MGADEVDAGAGLDELARIETDGGAPDVGGASAESPEPDLPEVETFEAVADTYIRGGSHAEETFGEHHVLEVKFSEFRTNCREAFLRFDVSTSRSGSDSVASLRFEAATTEHEEQSVTPCCHRCSSRERHTPHRSR